MKHPPGPPILSGSDLAGRIARCVTHEVNSPLTLVVTSLGCLRDDLSPEVADEPDLDELRSLVDDASQGVERVNHLLRAFRAVARAPADRVVRVDVNESLQLALDLIRRELDAGGRVELRLGAPPPVDVRGGLLQAFTHLLVTVSEVIAQGGVEISSSADAGEARLWVECEAERAPGPLEPGLFHDAVTAAGGRYEVRFADGRASVEVHLPGA